MRRCCALDRAEGFRRRDADRRAAQLAAVARQGQDLGQAPKKFIQIDIEPKEMDSNVGDSWPRGRATSVHACQRCCRAWAAAGPRRRPIGPQPLPKARRECRQDGAAPDETKLADGLPRRARGAAPVVKERPDAILVNEGANTLDLARGIIDMYQPRKRIDVGTWGIMGIGMGYAIAAAVETGKAVLAWKATRLLVFPEWRSKPSAYSCRSAS